MAEFFMNLSGGTDSDNVENNKLQHVKGVCMYQVDYNSYRSVNGFNRRVRFLIMHYTALDFENSIIALTGSSVSAHYLVPDPSDKSYTGAGFKDMRIFNLVDENERAWHAGGQFVGRPQ
jgi:N-acetyl-anhydromuramyl-L-alanine amidase AmpD